MVYPCNSPLIRIAPDFKLETSMPSHLASNHAMLVSIDFLSSNLILFIAPSHPTRGRPSCFAHDFLVDKPPHPPCMTSGAAFHMGYAHVLPALMLSNFLKRSQSDNVDMTVLCQGYGYKSYKSWWAAKTSTATAKNAAEFLVNRKDFQA